MSSYSNPVIAEFVRQFKADQDAYEQLRATAEKNIRGLLEQKGIMALVTSRVKAAERLEQKLLGRDAERVSRGGTPYRSPEDIFGDIPDLIGARIALYFPSDTARIGDLLATQFEIVKPKVFPEKVENYDDLHRDGFTAYKRKIYEGYDARRFDGYCAVHYRVRLAKPPKSPLSDITIEIQVASVLMHAWSEVEHDLAYKKMMGDVTREEYECLDEINGLVMAGEIALNRLNQLSQKRIQSSQAFDTHYTLASYLSQWQEANGYGSRPLGNVEDLFNGYQESGQLTRAQVSRKLHKLESQNWADAPEFLADQLLHQLKPTTVAKVVSQSIAKRNDSELTEAQLGKFLRRWNTLDTRIRAALRRKGYDNIYRNRMNELVEKEYLLSEEFGVTYRRLRMLRNDIVHGQHTPSLEEFNQLMDEIEKLSSGLDD